MSQTNGFQMEEILKEHQRGNPTDRPAWSGVEPHFLSTDLAGTRFNNTAHAVPFFKEPPNAIV